MLSARAGDWDTKAFSINFEALQAVKYLHIC